MRRGRTFARRSLSPVRLDDIDYELPDALIAQKPVEPRDAARLLVDVGGGPVRHLHVSDLPSLLEEGDVLEGYVSKSVERTEL